MITIHFQDHGQDFLEWDVDASGKVVESRPFQNDIWTRFHVFRPWDLRPGAEVIVSKDMVTSQAMKYRVERIEQKPQPKEAAHG